LLTLYNCSRQGSEDSDNGNGFDETDDESSDCESFTATSDKESQRGQCQDSRQHRFMSSSHVNKLLSGKQCLIKIFMELWWEMKR